MALFGILFQVSGVWLLYKSNDIGDGYLSASLNGLTVMDDREGIEQELRLAIGKSEEVGISPIERTENGIWSTDRPKGSSESDVKLHPTMLIFDAKFSKALTSISLCVQKPHLLVVLDFLLAVVEFFAPAVGNMLNGDDKQSSQIVDAIILDQSTFRQPSPEISLSPERPLIVDDERFDHFIYDGQGGVLYLKDRQGSNLSAPSLETIIYVGNEKKLQFKNVTIKVIYYVFFYSIY